MMDTPLLFVKEGGTCSYNLDEKQCCFDVNYVHKKTQEFKKIDITGDGNSDKNAIFNNNCGDIHITECNFINCRTTKILEVVFVLNKIAMSFYTIQFLTNANQINMAQAEPLQQN